MCDDMLIKFFCYRFAAPIIDHLAPQDYYGFFIKVDNEIASMLSFLFALYYYNII